MLEVGEILKGSQFARQIEMETEAITRGVARYWRLAGEATSRGDAAALKPVERLLLYWFLPLRQIIMNEQASMAVGKAGKHRSSAGPVILSLDADRLAVIAMHVTLGQCLNDPSGVKFVSLSYAIGNAVVAEIHLQQMKRETPETLKELDKRFKSLNVARVNRWAKKSLSNPKWQRSVCVQVGSILTDSLFKVAEIKNPTTERGAPEFIKAFNHGKVYRGAKSIGMVRLSDAAKSVIDDGHLYRQLLRPRFLPMLVKPYKWLEDGTEGGYIRVRTPLVAKPTKEQLGAINEAGSALLYEGVNALGAVPWQINKPVLRMQKMIWDQGGSVVGLPASDPLPLPPKPSDIETNAAARSEWKIQAHEVYSHNAQAQGRRVEFMQRLSIAEDLADEPEIFFPHQIDFRTRCYPIPVHLNLHQDKIGRSLLLLGNEQSVDSRGEWWQKVHAANVWGLDKASFDQRVSWTESQVDSMWAVSKNPEETIDYWGKADEPWLFLASCFSMFDDQLAAHMPVAVDGTCNGLQHYSAAGLDSRGGAAVNLIPSSTPADVYSDVLEIVIDRVSADARAKNEMAQLVLPLLERRHVKQPVMTKVYNVTRIGARLQVAKQLQKSGVDKKVLYPSANYLSGVVLDSVGDICSKAVEIMDWIEVCIREMCRQQPHETIRWTTPIGVPVVQPYRNPGKFRVKTILQHVTLNHEVENSPVKLSKQVQGGPPNWVHSMDATHMIGTALDCSDEEIDFAEVHDEFWCHAANMDRMNEILRHQFIEMYLSNRLMALYNEWSEHYDGLPLPPERGDLDIEAVRVSEYFFS